ncbi:hypothetical protein ACK83U_13185 [Rhizobium sp. WW22]|uniref:hypothetical protein n=1 Tax=Rhizobium sp. WW22 TaxID=3389070 RepID=UPI000DDB6F3A
MERLQRLSNGTLMPNDLDKVRIVFNEVIKQTWFDPNDYSKEGFASKLIVLFQCGIVRPDQLTKVAFLLALNDFCHDIPNVQRAKLKAAYKRSPSIGRAPLAIWL